MSLVNLDEVIGRAKELTAEHAKHVPLCYSAGVSDRSALKLDDIIRPEPCFVTVTGPGPYGSRVVYEGKGSCFDECLERIKQQVQAEEHRCAEEEQAKKNYLARKQREREVVNEERSE